MPSDFISLLSSDLDLNSPKSLYSKESVYDLLPKELQLQQTSSTSQTDTPTMSQTSGGEAGPPPSAALASGNPGTMTQQLDQCLRTTSSFTLPKPLLPSAFGVVGAICGVFWEVKSSLV
ncbi:hypothetical protein DPEC_G00165590 [Dallia pectoralis]|uniref:Uncharacterized protein n=1 Tax=Dallia pectoralis TaxID=75939 RepID=A0ACC2GHT0_DALPE|nr:hypothetical protein DPEC_G00165590 [Dallia pectoralis]